MKREFNFEPEEENDDIDFFPNDDENCPYMDILAAMILTNKPFGIMWTNEKMVEFLKARRYRIVSKKEANGGEEYLVAAKVSDSSIPDVDHSNIKEVFDFEVMDIISKWLLKIASEV